MYEVYTDSTCAWPMWAGARGSVWRKTSWLLEGGRDGKETPKKSD